jgi:hypothetical protein
MKVKKDERLEKYLADLKRTGKHEVSLRTYFPARVQRDTGQDRTLPITCSTDGVKRDGNTIHTDGWELGNYTKTGAPVLWCHDLRSVAIGNAPDMRVQKVNERTVLACTIHFAPAEVKNEFADLVYRSYLYGVMRSGSVQWNPIEWQPRQEDGRIVGWEFIRQELLEFSLCPVPADPDAIVRAVQTRIFTSEEAEKLVNRLSTDRPLPLTVRVEVDLPEETAPSATAREKEVPATESEVTASDPEPQEDPEKPADDEPPLAAAAERTPEKTEAVVLADLIARDPGAIIAALKAAGIVVAVAEQRGELQDALDNDEQAKMYDALRQYDRMCSHIANIAYTMTAGDAENEKRIGNMLKEFGVIAQPHLMAVAECATKNQWTLEEAKQRALNSPSKVETQQEEPAQTPEVDDAALRTLSASMTKLATMAGVTTSQPDLPDKEQFERAHQATSARIMKWLESAAH